MRQRQTVFLDTNVLVYVYDGRDPQKRGQASRLLKESLSNNDRVVISSQVITEFCNVMTTKKGILIKAPDLHMILDDILRPLLAHVPSVDFYQDTLTLLDKCSLNFYDALIVQAALDLECDILYSEDLQDGQKFGSLTIQNPFKDRQ